MSQELTETIRDKYGAVARSGLSNADTGVERVAEAFGYSREELASIPAGANMGLSCGNPLALASLKPGEVVVDLGCGGGLDVFLAAGKVGPAGKAIGIDMTPAMLERARKNAAEGGYCNVEFHEAQIDRLPLAAGSADCIISNCVINLAADKRAVFREMYRVLKPGGRVAVSDIALKQPLPDDLARDIMAYVGCIAGAILIEDYIGGLKAAGFEAVEVVDSGADLNAYAQVDGQSGCCSPPMTGPTAKPEATCCSPGGGCCDTAKEPPTAAGASVVHEELSNLLSRYDVNAYAVSVKVFAVKPRDRG